MNRVIAAVVDVVEVVILSTGGARVACVVLVVTESG
jgi:hypothetical protein